MLGVVYDPYADELYTAVKGEGPRRPMPNPRISIKNHQISSKKIEEHGAPSTIFLICPWKASYFMLFSSISFGPKVVAAGEVPTSTAQGSKWTLKRRA